MARGNLPAQTPLVSRDSFIAFDLLYRYVSELEKDLKAIEGTTLTTAPARISDTTLALDSKLSVPLAAGQKVRVRAKLFGTANLKLRHVGPAGAALVLLERTVLAGTLATSLDTAYSAADIIPSGVNIVTIEGIIHNGATAGPFGISWAQAVSSVTPAGFYPGSVLSYSLIA